MADVTNDSPNKTPRFREAYERLVVEIQAVPASDLVPITLDLQSTVTTVLGVWNEIRGFRADFVSALPSFDITLFDALESYALALGHTQTVYQTANEPPTSLVLLAGTVNKTREILVANVTLLIAMGLLEASVLGDLKGANGHKNIGFDVFALSNILKKNWAQVSSKLTLTLVDLDVAENEADKLVTAVGERERAPAVAAQTTRERHAAFVLMARAYEEVRTALGFLRRKQRDVDRIAPSLYAGRATARKSNSTPAPNATDSVVQAPLAVATPNQPKPTTSAVNVAGPYA